MEEKDHEQAREEHRTRQSLARTFVGIQALQKMSDEELRALDQEYHQEIGVLKNRIDAMEEKQLVIRSIWENQWLSKARRALSTLKQHKEIIQIETVGRLQQAKKARREQAAVDKEKNREAKAIRRAKNAVLEEAKRVERQAAHEAKLVRDAEAAQRKHELRVKQIQEANSENARHIAVFKEVALEVLGRELYEHLWELTNQRLNPGPYQ